MTMPSPHPLKRALAKDREAISAPLRPSPRSWHSAWHIVDASCMFVELEKNFKEKNIFICTWIC